MADERARFEKWCPITIIDAEKAPKAAALKKAYFTSWEACAFEYAPVVESLRASRDALKSAETYFVGLAAYLATCNTDVIVENLETIIANLHVNEKSARGAVGRAESILKDMDK